MHWKRQGCHFVTDNSWPPEHWCLGQLMLSRRSVVPPTRSRSRLLKLALALSSCRSTKARKTYAGKEGQPARFETRKVRQGIIPVCRRTLLCGTRSDRRKETDRDGYNWRRGVRKRKTRTNCRFKERVGIQMTSAWMLEMLVLLFQHGTDSTPAKLEAGSG